MTCLKVWRVYVSVNKAIFYSDNGLLSPILLQAIIGTSAGLF